jgi:hypothetical protein
VCWGEVMRLLLDLLVPKAFKMCVWGWRWSGLEHRGEAVVGKECRPLVCGSVRQCRSTEEEEGSDWADHKPRECSVS